MEQADNQSTANNIAQGVESTCSVNGGPQNLGLLAQLAEALPKPEAQAPAFSENAEAIAFTNSNNDDGPTLG